VRLRAVLTWALCAIAGGLLVTSIVLSLVLGTWGPDDTGLVIPLAIGTIAMAVIGALVASRTGNAIGWIPLATGIAMVTGYIPLRAIEWTSV
jgi:hypothetical protein